MGSARRSAASSRHQAFALVELLVVVLIAGSLLTLALPGYSGLVSRAARAEAKAELRLVELDQERYFSRHMRYIDDALPLRIPVQSGRQRWTGSGRYSIEVTHCDEGDLSSCFEATAVPQGEQSTDSCGSLQLSSSGTRTVVGGEFSSARCWGP